MRAASRTGALAAAVALSSSLQLAGASIVDCGGHFSTTCEGCPDGNGYVWCNGDCEWRGGVFSSDDGRCVAKTALPCPIHWLDHLLGGRWYWWYYTSFAFAASVMLVFACVYYTQVVKNLPVVKDDIFNVAARERKLFACFGNRPTCLYTTFCLPVVAGKNYNAAQVMGFWPGCIFTFLSFYTPFYFLTVCIRAILSIKVEEALGHEEGFLKACVYSMFCMPCDIGRESMEVDDELGATITCCCKVHVKPRIATEVENVKSRLCDKW